MSTPTKLSYSLRRRKPSSGQTGRKSPTKLPERPSPASRKSQARRLFTDDDEIHLLKAFHKLTKESTSLVDVGSPVTALVGKSLSGDFSHAQVTNKLHSLRVKYHKTARTKSLIKTPHDRQTYEISRKIWGKDPVQRRKSGTQDAKPKSDVWTAGKEGSDLENFPVLMTQVSRLFPGNGAWRDGLRRLESSKLRALNDKWMVQEIEEAVVLAKKAELFHEQSKLILEAIVSSSSS